jgi:transposase-like protein
VHRAVDGQGQFIVVFVSKQRDTKTATRFFSSAVSAISAHGAPTEVTTDRSPTLARVITEPLPLALHDTTQYANNLVEADHGRLKARLRPLSGLKGDRMPAPSCEVTSSSKICGEATTNSESMRYPARPWRPFSTRWR